MTVTPMGLAPAGPGRGTTRPDGDTAAAAEGFGALVAAQLAAVVAGSPLRSVPVPTPDPVTTSAGDVVAEGAPELLTADPVDADAVTAPEGPGPGDLTGLALLAGPQVVLVPPATGGTVGSAADADATQRTVAASATVAVAAQAAVPVGGVTGPAQNPVQTGTAEGGAAPASASPQAAAGGPAAESVTADLDATAGRAPAPNAGSAAVAEAAVIEGVSALGITAPTAAAAALGTAGATAGGSSGPVTAQVFPTVPALLTRGEGTHSLMLRLHPADLGEVQVTVTVRDGVVDVTLSAGREAQLALRTGVGELRSLIDLAGATSGHVVIRDLPGGAAPAAQPPQPTAQGGSVQLPSGQASPEHANGQGAGERGTADHGTGRDRGGTPADAPAPGPTRTSPTSGLDLVL